jgi:hypothetical protein
MSEVSVPPHQTVGQANLSNELTAAPFHFSLTYYDSRVQSYCERKPRSLFCARP